MKKKAWIGVVLAGVMALSQFMHGPSGESVARTREPAMSGSTAEVLGVYFTPEPGAAQAIVSAVDAGQHEVLVQAYSFTHQAIAQALARAQARGVQVRVLLDGKSDDTNRRIIQILRQAGVAMREDDQHQIAHNKVMVIDGQVVVTGSFNFTHAAETHNAENFLVLRSQPLAQAYKSNWEVHWAHSQ